MSQHVTDAIAIAKVSGFDCIILESSGIGQSDTEIVDLCSVSLYVMTPEYGAATQLEKIDMLDFADAIAINKFDKRGALDALRDVRKQYRRNRKAFDTADEEVPVFGTVASQFNDPGMNQLYLAVRNRLAETAAGALDGGRYRIDAEPIRAEIIPPARVRYLSEIASALREYDSRAETEADRAEELGALTRVARSLNGPESTAIEQRAQSVRAELSQRTKEIIDTWDQQCTAYRDDEFTYTVRGKPITTRTHRTTLSGLRVPRVATPRLRSWGDRVRWTYQENYPGAFPFTAGVFPFKREGEDPTRMFAGEGGPERTNKRFHYVSTGMPAKRLSTAFDSVTLYGEDPDHRPDIYGKIGNSGVSVCSVDDAKRLYSGFDLASPKTSVSMTINGPAAMLTAFFMNAAIDQQCERYIREQGKTEEVQAKLAKHFDSTRGPQPLYRSEIPHGNDGLGLLLLGTTGDRVLERGVYERIKADTLAAVRGTVQADILKEDQAQNTCIFSTEFSLRLMGDVQQYFIDHNVRNFYSVSISGYHIAEAGANP
ncbi:MAG: methylmalonyl-CoA mutase, partial [Bdellovibrionales bacterium]|nr:methylmalonyl-CoA mutase [Bdellovibrionales bacterium]